MCYTGSFWHSVPVICVVAEISFPSLIGTVKGKMSEICVCLTHGLKSVWWRNCGRFLKTFAELSTPLVHDNPASIKFKNGFILAKQVANWLLHDELHKSHSGFVTFAEKFNSNSDRTWNDTPCLNPPRKKLKIWKIWQYLKKNYESWKYF